MKPEPIIMRDSPEAAQLVTVTGWRSRRGVFFGDDESTARYDGATHQKCECGFVHEIRGYCRSCYEKRRLAQYLSLPLVEYDGGWFCFFDADGNGDFFEDLDAFYAWAMDQDDYDPASVHLVLCDERMLGEVSSEYWCEDLPEDGELPGDVQNALDALNAVIRAQTCPCAYVPGDKRIATPEIPKDDP